MKNLLSVDFSSFRRLGQKGDNGVIALSLENGRLEAVVMRRKNGSAAITHHINAPLSLDPLTNDAELVGREIRNALEAAGIRERRCAVDLPLKWALTRHTEIPDLKETEIDGFLQIEAERSFPFDLETLLVADSRASTTSGKRYGFIVAVPRNHVMQLEQVLKAAGLRGASFSFGLTALQPPARSGAQAMFTVAIGESQVGLEVTAGGGLFSLRTLEGALSAANGSRQLETDLIAREIRITLGQLPPEVRDALRVVHIYGPRDLAQQLADEIELRLEPLGVAAEVATRYAPDQFGIELPADAPVSPLVALGAHFLAGQPAAFEFLPPKVSQWETLVAKYASGKLQKVAALAAVPILLAGFMFAFQQWQLWRLESEWNRIKVPVTQAKDLQRRLAQFRPWTDKSFRALNILKRTTEAFPEDGSVTVKMLEVRDLSVVTCTGTARDYQALLKTVERLRAKPEVPDVSLGQTRGNSPALQFTLSFAWNEGGKRGN